MSLKKSRKSKIHGDNHIYDGKQNYRKHKKKNGKKIAAAITCVLVIFTLVLAFSPAARSFLINGANFSHVLGGEKTASDQTQNINASETTLGDHKDQQSTVKQETEPSETVLEEAEIEIVAVGDVLLHMPVIEGVKRVVDGETEYNFDPVFKYVKNIIDSADYSILNFEGTLGGEPYSGYPMFSAPDDIVPSLIRTGFDLASTVNNHSIDRGLAGLIRTAEVFRENGLPNIGTKANSSDKSYRVENVNGITIGFSSFSFETIGTETNRALNGITMPVEAEDLIDSFNPYRAELFEADVQNILDRVELMREEGAEFICLIMHWGDEYAIHSNPYQQFMAQTFADAEVDLIIGHHPHVVQEVDFVKSSKSDHEMLVYYSLGNFISNQYFDTGNASGRGQDGLMARVIINKSGNEIKITRAEYIPIHVVRVQEEGIPSHRVVAVVDALEDPASFDTTSDLMQASLDRTEAVMAANGQSGRIDLHLSGS